MSTGKSEHLSGRLAEGRSPSASSPSDGNAPATDPVDDRDRLIRELRAARDQALASGAAKSAFLASVSHELRTPLNAILGFAEMIAQERLGPIAQRRYPEYANDIGKSARRLLDILSDMLDMARLEAGRTTAQRALANLTEIVEETLAMLAARAPSTPQAALKTRLSPFTPALWTDRHHLRQILVNVLANALAFTPPDGEIVLSSRVTAEGGVEIAVADTGVGMTPKEIGDALTRFGHAEEEFSRNHTGIGLGLPLAKSLTELIGGTLNIASTPGEGTTVTLHFPLESIRERAGEWAKPQGRMAERARRLLGQADTDAQS